jgi:predicted outer membrane lipoprotein
MSNVVKVFALAMVVALALFIAVVCGGYAPWYFAWLVGTTMIVLISVSGAVLLETQESVRNETSRPADGGVAQ